MGPCYGPLIDSGMVSSMACGMYLVCIGVQLRGPN